MVTESTPPRHPRTSPQTRRQIVAQYRSSQLTPRAFCEQRGLRLSTLHGWLVQARRTERAPVTFTEVSGPDAGASRVTPVTEWAAEIVWPTGVILRLRDPVPPAAVRELLRGGRC
jgi:transposase-like protein